MSFADRIRAEIAHWEKMASDYRSDAWMIAFGVVAGLKKALQIQSEMWRDGE